MLKILRTPRFIQRLYPRRTWSFSFLPNQEKKIYITFDDGPIPEVTLPILKLLAQHKAKATFFCVGSNVDKYPQIFNQILDDGHAVGNHTQTHKNGYKSENTAYLIDVKKGKDKIKSNLFRPPYGRMTRKQEKLLPIEYKIIMWSFLSYDYDKKVETSKIIKKFNQIKGGDIIVLHDNIKSKERSLLLLESLLKQIKEKGFTTEIISSELCK